MLYLIGLGLNQKGISKEGLEVAKRCKKVYLENYTVNFPFSLKSLIKEIGKEIKPLEREKVEDLSLIDEAKRKDIALLIYGSPLTATTHITLVDEAKHSKVKCKVIHAGSIFEAVAETGLQLYKFGKIASMPKWNPEKNFIPDSFMEIIKQNQSIQAHTLLLTDIDLHFDHALEQLIKASTNYNLIIKKLIICQQLGTKKGKILYRPIDELKDFKGVKKPYCIIIPGKLHFAEKDFLNNL